jgi:hypothetical protein
MSGQMSEQRDAAILASMRGNGRIVLATLLAEAWDALQRRDYHALRALCGVAPITKRSGKSRIVIRRLACHPRLRNAVYHWANAAIQHDDKSRAKYDALRARGHSHARALRSVADRLLAVACSFSFRLCMVHGVNDIGICRAAAQVAAHEFPDLSVGTDFSLIHASNRRHDLARRAISALEGIVVDKSLLHGVQDRTRNEAFNRSDRLAGRQA